MLMTVLLIITLASRAKSKLDCYSEATQGYIITS